MIDTRNKRASVLGFALAALVVLPAPDAVIDQADRQHVTFSYAGISAALPVPVPTSVRFVRAQVGSVAAFTEVRLGDVCRFANTKVGA